MNISATTLDDLLIKVFRRIKRTGTPIEATRGKTREIQGALLKLEQPRARISHSETRGHILGPIGEFFWYLSGSNDVNFISYYLPKYKKEAEKDESVHGAYGPRILGKKFKIFGKTSRMFYKRCRINQFASIIRILKEKPYSRQAVIQIFDKKDIGTNRYYKNIPCTCTLQFMIRDNALDMFTHMRSNDAFLGLYCDIFSFTMLQEILAHILKVEVGTYHHFVNSLHIYEENMKKVNTFLKEPYQITQPMPEMPKDNLCRSLRIMMKIEENIRKNKNTICIDDLRIDTYWKDIAYLLQIHSIRDSIRTQEVQISDAISIIKNLQNQITSNLYRKYARNILGKLEQRLKK